MASHTIQKQPVVQSNAPIKYNTHVAASQPAYPPIPLTITSPPLRYSKRAALGLGLTQMTIGVLFVIFMVIEMSVCPFYYRNFFMISGYGIWCGAIFIVTGLLGYFSSLKKYGKRMIVSFMVMSIISACFTLISFTSSALLPGPSYYYMSYYENENSDKYNTATAMSILLAILSVVEAGVAIASSALGCRAVCCCQNAQDTSIQIYDPTTRQVTFIPVQTFPSYNAGATYPPTEVIPPYNQSNIGATNDGQDKFQINVNGLPD